MDPERERGRGVSRGLSLVPSSQLVFDAQSYSRILLFLPWCNEEMNLDGCSVPEQRIQLQVLRHERFRWVGLQQPLRRYGLGFIFSTLTLRLVEWVRLKVFVLAYFVCQDVSFQTNLWRFPTYMVKGFDSLYWLLKFLPSHSELGNIFIHRLWQNMLRKHQEVDKPISTPLRTVHILRKLHSPRRPWHNYT